MKITRTDILALRQPTEIHILLKETQNPERTNEILKCRDYHAKTALQFERANENSIKLYNSENAEQIWDSKRRQMAQERLDWGRHIM